MNDSDRLTTITDQAIDHLLKIVLKPSPEVITIDDLSRQLKKDLQAFIELSQLNQVSPLIFHYSNAEEVSKRLFDHYQYLKLDHSLTHVATDYWAKELYNELKCKQKDYDKHTLLRTQKHIELFTAFQQQGIPMFTLKGMALMNMIYPTSTLRPCCDIDILVAPEDVEKAKAIVRLLGFSMPDQQKTSFLKDNHHEPEATYHEEGMQVSLEVHTDCINRDSPHTLVLDDVYDFEYVVDMSGSRKYMTLPPTQMLIHLCIHLQSTGRVHPLNCGQPANMVKLINMIDIILFVEKYYLDIDWQTIRADWQEVIVALELIYPIFSITKPVLLDNTDALDWHNQQRALYVGVLNNIIAVKDIHVKQPGYSMKGVSVLFKSNEPFKKRILELLNPPEWWLRLKYAVSKRHSLNSVRFFHHPVELGRLFIRRIISVIYTKVGLA